MSYNEDGGLIEQADIAYRRRALRVNSGIYARRCGADLLPSLNGARIRARYVAMLGWLGSETAWRAEDARRVNELAAEIGRLARSSRLPKVADLCNWHADRLRELVGQHAALRRLEAAQRTVSPWPAPASRGSRLRRKPCRSNGAQT